MARQSSAPNSATESAQSQATELTAHPKIARRPAQWKRVVTVTSDAPSEKVPTPTQATFSPTAWQDDIRFGIWLLVAVAALNILLLYTVDAGSDRAPESSLMIQQVTRAPVLPTPRTSDHGDVRMFAGPKEDKGMPVDDGFETWDE